MSVRSKMECVLWHNLSAIKAWISLTGQDKPVAPHPGAQDQKELRMVTTTSTQKEAAQEFQMTELCEYLMFVHAEKFSN